MNSLNSVLLDGELACNPESRITPNGSVVTEFKVVSSRFYKQDNKIEKEASTFEVEAWAKLAQTCAEELGKGSMVRVVGRLKQDRWTDSEGKQRSKVKVVAEHVELRSVNR